MNFLREAGLVRGEWVAIDGSKFQAVASSKSVPSMEALQRQVAHYLQSDPSQSLNGGSLRNRDSSCEGNEVRVP